MDARKKVLGAVVAILLALATFAVACDDSSSAVKEAAPGQEGGPPLSGQEGGPGPGQDSGPGQGQDGGPTDCVQNPTTHAEIINACTDAVKITKNPTLPLRYPDGGLPPLP